MRTERQAQKLVCIRLDQHQQQMKGCQDTLGAGPCVGDRYEGEWQDGLEWGTGTYIAADGSSYYGTWAMGRMHGEGVCTAVHLSMSLLQQGHARVGGLLNSFRTWACRTA